MNIPPARFRSFLRIVTVIYWIAIFVLTHLPPMNVPRVRTSDKLLHFTGYLLLGFFVYLSVRPRGKMVPGLLGIIMLYAMFDEITQPLMGRSTELNDWFADCAGAAGAWIICTLIERLKRV